MTKKDTIKILAGINALYPRFTVTGKKEIAVQVYAWFTMLEDLEAELVGAALKKWAATSSYPPTVHDLRNAALEICAPGSELTAIESWGEVMNAIGKFGYYQAEAALENMSEITREVVRGMDFQRLCLSENNLADRAHFLKQFENYHGRVKRACLIPPQVKNLIGRLAEAKALPAPVQTDAGRSPVRQGKER